MKTIAIISAAVISLGFASIAKAQSDSEPSQYFEPTIILDYDNDGWTDAIDNCPVVPNTVQVDSDGDAIDDACDECDSNIVEACHNQFDDSIRELSFGDYARMASGTDSDRDGYSNLADNCPAIANLDQNDRDGDSVGDFCDNCPDDPAPGYTNGCPID